MTFRSQYNEMAQRVPLLATVKRRVLKPIDEAIHRQQIEIVRRLKAFVPNSVADPRTLAELTLLAAEQSFPFLVDLVEVTKGERCAEPIPIETFADTPEKTAAAASLKLLLDKHGSDKANRHNYHNLYGPILAGVCADCNLLEVGLGTNNVDVASNMGRHGRPGASLRAFSAFKPLAQVYGADIDRRILFNEGNIRTHYVDQTNPTTLRELGRTIDRQFDFVVDDGLHSPNANLATMTFALRHLKPGGWLVIEDIGHTALPIWQVVQALMPPTLQSCIVESRVALMFAVHRLPKS